MIPFGNEQPRRPEEEGPFVLRLYVVDEGPSSARAIANLSAICKNHLPDNHQIEIVDPVSYTHLTLPTNREV